ncbi:hypothetical protein QYE76_045197 [Lolium multiflorum]|uniref:EF-hand domain-containing protein n=1 Tax=Lolium multiflorum TaxID=4521 RepID=A0AAD8WXU2_LOLMU|nr:hypothetical protein QYE76_045197 [Lolium multiflorum]
MAGEDQPLTDYEKERLSRIRENEARLQALGIRRLAASPLLNQPSSAAAAAAAKRKQKKRSDDVDEEYLPSDESGGEEEEENGETSSASDEYDGKETKASSRSRQKGKKKKLLNSGSSSKSTFREEGVPVTDFMDEDAALQQAIALSLAEPSQNSVTAIGAETSSAGVKGRRGTPCENKNNTPIQDSAKNRKTKKQVRSRIQLSEDDVVAFFFSFDEARKGHITPWDLERMANVNDFIWTDSEISKMIQCFDSDRDGKINLEDFRAIVSRCNMLQEPGQ